MVDNIFSITDKLRIKMTTILLDSSSDPWLNKRKDTVYYSRVIRWDLKIDCVTSSNTLKSIGSVQFTGGDLLMLENLLTNVVLNDWFLNYKCGKTGVLSTPNQGESRRLILENGGVIIFKPIVLGRTRAISMKLSDDIEDIVDEFRVRDLIYFLKKFDPYTYASITAYMMENKPDQHLNNIKKNFFDSNNPMANQDINKMVPSPPKLVGKQIGDGKKSILP